MNSKNLQETTPVEVKHLQAQLPNGLTAAMDNDGIAAIK